MAYQIWTEGSLHQVVLVLNGRAIRILNTFSSLAEARQLLSDLSSWRL